MILTFGVLLPVGAFMAHNRKHLVHKLMQPATTVLGLAGLALAVAYVQMTSRAHFRQTVHAVVGVVVLALTLATPLLLARVQWRRWHRGCGHIIIGLGIANVLLVGCATQGIVSELGGGEMKKLLWLQACFCFFLTGMILSATRICQTLPHTHTSRPTSPPTPFSTGPRNLARSEGGRHHGGRALRSVAPGYRGYLRPGGGGRGMQRALRAQLQDQRDRHGGHRTRTLSAPDQLHPQAPLKGSHIGGQDGATAQEEHRLPGGSPPMQQAQQGVGPDHAPSRCHGRRPEHIDGGD